MAFGAVGILILAESFCAVMAYPAVLILTMSLSGHLQVFFFHLENFGVAVGAFQFVLIDMGFMAEEDRAAAPLGFKFDVPAADFFLLSIGHIEGGKTQNANTDR